ncbi:KAP family P-loop NTPase fold protein [Agitococcus lubricus]|uniref:KAP-like P-loop domain-containing protein n=1 Tax=Agitococcus lubricus TaxID=1077255 RepID=A0A2T5IYD8_9GAMM|nr:P-loop NTPase fold protein [Agitococcus lubricus]PTQ89006.1 KAP-like P-loop domain-containing protein [Agitococcus lubricus]
MSEQLHNLTHKIDDFNNIETPFEGDVLEREKFAKKMTNYLSRLKAGAVLAIDTPWGEGKTWFGRHWNAYLQSDEQNYRTIYIDAFENDYVEDPFLLIATEIAQLIKKHQSISQDFIQASASVMKTILPLAATSLLNLMGLITIGKIGLSEDIKEVIDNIKENSIEGVNEWIQEKFDNHESEKQSIKNFKEKLEIFAKEDEKPIVIFIDELDRCRPDFAIKLIERIKHFFNVENVVFVLLLNREQLHHAIKGVYGSETDAATYLGKFVNFFFSLPKPHSDNPNNYYESAIFNFIKCELKKYQDVSINTLEFFALANLFKLSLRDIEKAIALYVFSNTQDRETFASFILYAIVLKIKDIQTFKKLLTNDLEISAYLGSKLDKGHRVYKSDVGTYSILGMLADWHNYHTLQTLPKNQVNSEEFNKLFPHLKLFLNYRTFYQPIDSFFEIAANKIDISIS